MLTQKILKVGNSRALVLDRAIAEALGLDADASEIPIKIEDGRVTLLPPDSLDPFEALRKKLARYPEAEARKMAADAVAAVRPKRTIPSSRSASRPKPSTSSATRASTYCRSRSFAWRARSRFRL